MANSAFDHEPSITVPGASPGSTNDAVVRWDGTGGLTLQNSVLIVSDAGVVTGVTTLAASTSITVPTAVLTNSTNAYAITLNTGATAANYTITMPTALPGAAGKVLQSSGGSPHSVLEWATPSGGPTLAGDTTDNNLVTTTNSTTLNGEANLTFNGSVLSLASSNNGNPNQILIDNDSDTAGSHSQLRLKVQGSSSGDPFIDFTEAGSGQDWSIGIDVSDSKFKISRNAELGTNDVISITDNFKIIINQGASDDHVLDFKSSDISHTMANTAEADTFGFFQKYTSGNGGLRINGYVDGDTSATWENAGIVLGGFITNAPDTSKGTGSIGVITLDANRAYSSASSAGIQTGDGNLVSIRDETTTRFLFDIEGSGHADVEWTTYSDDRLKFNQEVIPYGLDTLMQLQSKIYDRDSGYLDNGVPVLEGKRRRQIGFIAQEVKEIIPEVVKDIDETESWYSLDDGKLMAVVIKAIQELKAEIDALKE